MPKVTEGPKTERENPREELLGSQSIKEYREWKENPITLQIIKILRSETRAPIAVPASIVEPKIACAMYHHRVGVDWAIDVMENLDVSQPMIELEATYGAETTGEQ